MKNRLYIIALLSIVTIVANAQPFNTNQEANQDVRTHRVIHGGAYTGTVYEPFSNTTPSEQSVIGSQLSNRNTSGPRRSKEPNQDPGITDDDSSPIGDAVLPLLLMAAAFAAVVAVRRKRTAKTNRAETLQ